METEKYYWMSHEWGSIKVDTVQTEHPFIVITQLRENKDVGALLNWKEISKEEYKLFNDILYNINKYI
jgi:hypothetical protein